MNISKDAFMEMEEITSGPWIKTLRGLRSGIKLPAETKEESKRLRSIVFKWSLIEKVIYDYLYYQWDEPIHVIHFFTKEEEESGDPLYGPIVHYRRTDTELMQTLAEANVFAMNLIGRKLFDLNTNDPLKTGILEYDDCRIEYLIQNRDALNFDDFDIEILKMKINRLDLRNIYRKKIMS